MSQLIVQIYILSHTALKPKARFVKVNHNLLHIVLQVNQSAFSRWNPRETSQTTGWHPNVVCGAMHWLVKSDEFNNLYSLLYILFKFWLCCCSLHLLRSNELVMNGWERMFERLKTVSNTFWTAKEKFRVDAVNIQTAKEDFLTDDASHSNGKQRILNGWCQAFKRKTENF